MKRRTFLHTLGLGTAALSWLPSPLRATESPHHWAWLRATADQSDDQLNQRFDDLLKAGVTAVLLGGHYPRSYTLARQAGLEVHAWMWTLCRGDLMETLPDHYAVSREGRSTIEHPPYVGYYRFLCPSRPEVLAHLTAQVADLADHPDLAGVHLDYVRYPDVILPRGLWEKYGLVQDHEIPEFDFCYCPVCRSLFQEQHGYDPGDQDDPTSDEAWRRYRWDSITTVVNHLATVVHGRQKQITAAVFPTPTLARQLVRQDWTRWNLDAVLPMIYNTFYLEDVDWIKTATREGVIALDGRFPLYAGLYLPGLPEGADLDGAVRAAQAGGASGVALFGGVRDIPTW